MGLPSHGSGGAGATGETCHDFHDGTFTQGCRRLILTLGAMTILESGPDAASRNTRQQRQSVFGGPTPSPVAPCMVLGHLSMYHPQSFDPNSASLGEASEEGTKDAYVEMSQRLIAGALETSLWIQILAPPPPSRTGSMQF